MNGIDNIIREKVGKYSIILKGLNVMVIYISMHRGSQGKISKICESIKLGKYLEKIFLVRNSLYSNCGNYP